DIPIKTLGEAIKGQKSRRREMLMPDRETVIEAIEQWRTQGLVAEALGISRSFLRFVVIPRYQIEWEIPWRSTAEISLHEWLKEIDPDGDWKNSDRSLINPFEIDIVSHVRKLAIEYCGVYWHSEMSGK